MADNNATNNNDVDAVTNKLQNTSLTTTAAPSGVTPSNQTNNNNNDESPVTTTNQPTTNEENKMNNDQQQQQQQSTNNQQNNDNKNNNNQQQQQQQQQQQPQSPPQQQAPQQQNNNNQQNNQQTPSGDTSGNQSNDDETNLIINYLPPTMSEGTLATLFSPYGSMERCKIVVDLQTLRSRGYGFVKYDNPQSAKRALQALNGYELNGKKLKVAFARAQCKAITNANLYITNVPPHFVDSDLDKLFQEYGKIVECRVLMDQNGKSRGVGFVRMDTHHNAIQALQAMDQYVIDDKHPPLLVKLAQRRVPRRYWNAQNRQNNQQNQGQYQQQGQQDNKNRRKKKKNSPKKYYPKNYQQNQGMGGGMNMNDNMVGGQPMGGNNMRGSPSKRGYYRPRQNQQQAQYKQRGRGPNQTGGPQYFQQPPMYDTPLYSQYGQPAYPINHMTAAANPIASGQPSGVGPKRNKQYPNQWE